VPPPTVYFVQSDSPNGPVKIGYTGRRVKERMAEGQTFAHQELTLLAETYGTMADEVKLHRLFAPLRVRGEWFRYEGDLRELVMMLMLDEGTLQSWLEAREG
jgi:hypothetical protein